MIEGRLRIGGDLIVYGHKPLLPDSKTLSIGRNANIRQNPAMRSCDRRRVATLLYDSLSIFEFGIVGLPRPELEVDWYKFETCSHQRGPLRTTGGVHVEARRGLQTLQQAGTIVISCWKRTSEPPPESLLKALRSAHAQFPVARLPPADHGLT